MKILILRTHYTESDTSGVMLVNDEFFGYTLEDKVRHTEKVKNHTAIPAGVYEVVVDYSPRFKRLMPRIKNVPNFIGIRIHGGNTHKNTAGCPLVAANRNLAKNRFKENEIWGSLEKKLTAKIKASNSKAWIEIINTAML